MSLSLHIISLLLILSLFVFMIQSLKSSLVHCQRIAKTGIRLRCLSTTQDSHFNQHIFSVAPMMEYTDRHQRMLTRIMSKQTVLYTEMVTTNALIHSGNPERFLQANIPIEDPVVLQLGGSDPLQMKEAAKMAHEYGYKEINLNIGCPSEKVSGKGCFGAVLYLNPQLVSELALAVGEATGKPATVKCRIGIDGHDSYDELYRFIRTVSEIGKVTHFIIHARIAVLGKKFTPKDNRTIPPLKYDTVYRLITDFPHLEFSLNGGVGSIESCKGLIERDSRLKGVMVGRAVVANPYAWSTVDSELYGVADPGLTRMEVLEQYIEYAAAAEACPGHPKLARSIVKPALNLFTGLYNGKLYRTEIDKYIQSGLSATESLQRASECIRTIQNTTDELFVNDNDAKIDMNTISHMHNNIKAPAEQFLST